jgi:hypothetical protein
MSDYVLKCDEPDVPPGFCIFCRERPSGPVCNYGLGHEVFKPESRPKQVAKSDFNRCTKCGLHPRNPASATNGCEHAYGAP